MARRTTQLVAGARALRTYLTKNGLSIQRFCAIHDLDRIAVQRTLKGERSKRVTVNFALAIERATDGAVSCAMWAADTAAA